MWNLKKQMNKETKQKQTHKTENKLVVARGEWATGKGKLGEGEWDVQASRQNE